ncbi:MAG: hypothetical protein EP312_09295 [Gammaproteobacteria bacterium]|nr:MAG: hypothetical protein EP312_09295 [Gammaproteobacteria bacterium]
MKRVWVISAVAALALGCSLFVRDDYRQFLELCEAESGLHVYKTVQADEVFYEWDSCNTTCAITLIDSQSLQRLGFCNKSYFGYFPDRKPPGCYVYEKGLKGDPACFNEIEGRVLLRKNKTFFEKQCVKLLPMEEEFRYRVRSDFRVDVIDKEISSAIQKSKFEVIDSNTSEVLLRKNLFSFIPKDYGLGKDYGSRVCVNTYYEKGGLTDSSLLDKVFH